MTDDFKDYPKSLGEIRSDKGDNFALTPRDILIDLLRKIDSGETVCNNLIMAYYDDKRDGYYHSESCQKWSMQIALCTLAMHRTCDDNS